MHSYKYGGTNTNSFYKDFLFCSGTPQMIYFDCKIKYRYRDIILILNCKNSVHIEVN